LLAAVTLFGQDFEAPQQTEYKGPAVLSRGRASSFPTALQSIRLRPFASAHATYSTNLKSADAPLEPAFDNYGYTIDAGVYGTQRWRRKMLTLGYRGGYSHNSRISALNGPEQTLTVDFNWQLSPRFALVLRENGGMSNRNLFYTYIYNANPWDYIPNNEAFDNRIYFSNSSAMLLFRKSARLSFSAAADYFIQHRASQLPSVKGTRARADVNYRMSRNVTVGAHYDYTTFSFTRGLGETKFHSVGIDYSQRFGPNWELVTSIGGSYLDNLGLVSIPADPELSLITGARSVVEARQFYTVVPRGRAVVTRRFRRGILGGEVYQDINPGNGLLLTARGVVANGFGSYSPSTKFRVHGASGWQRRSGVLSAAISSSHGYNSAAGVSYDIGRDLFLTSNLSYFNGTFGDTARKWIQVSAGVSYSPGEFPLALW
jgi:hypothetical protein